MAAVPQVDVVISVLNGRPFLEQAVRSVLDQEGVRTRVFVVDGGSTDGTVDLVRSWNDSRVYLQTDDGRRLGTGEARNVGARLGDAEWLSFIDADDLWPLGRTKKLLAGIEDADSQMAVGHMLTFNHGSDVTPDREYEVGDTPLATVVGGVMFTRRLFERIGDLDEDLRVGEFVDWMARARSAGVAEVPVPTVALLRRNHDANISRSRQSDYSDYLRLLVRHRERTKAASSGHEDGGQPTG